MMRRRMLSTSLAATGASPVAPPRRLAQSGNRPGARHSGLPRETAPARRAPKDALESVLIGAGIDSQLVGEELQEAVHRAIALRRYSCTWSWVPAGWVVTLTFPEVRRFFGTTLEEALTWCLAWIMTAKHRRPVPASPARGHRRTRLVWMPSRSS